MRDIVLVLFCGILMVGVMVFFLNMGPGGSAAGKKFDLGQWFAQMSHVQQAEQDAQIIGDKRREDDIKLKEAHQALEDRMIQQRDKMETAQDRIREMQERNDAQRMRLEAQMERMRNR